MQQIYLANIGGMEIQKAKVKTKDILTPCERNNNQTNEHDDNSYKKQQ
jgi:hypothetical protein